MRKFLIYLTLIFTSIQIANAAQDYVIGNLTKMTSITEGLLIKLEPENLPDVCKNKTAYGWMLIPQARKTIIAVTLSQWYQEKKAVVVYVDRDYSTNPNFCTVQQVEPQ
ncbi:ABC transporter ATP-binding protein [Acinetobacter seifertii]|uniref:ABC transporter ATP-binding protein n=1 Tax=Acinetobacter seifertii TaxID=1530123 RepID=A0A7H2V9E9_9GAMM|nr:ABC transporter ATP-binding protein [Acinetobacter seifertii]MBZ6534703.1 ABC transporter ATP-binding protein [Acinetobacter seifertii]QNW90846.1 ABC transporter ATP-binding protein [Acinetobacter seifertii]QNW97582.1 ABC transporter ATP-binding protein [Acinetobacter seifertii]QNX72982.1 ABC transporter ATP-binding protein [Acinetobacter seifertii]